MTVHDISGKHYYISVKRIDTVNELTHKCGVIAIGAGMKVRYLNNAVAVESSRQILDRNLNILHIKAKPVD